MGIHRSGKESTNPETAEEATVAMVQPGILIKE